MKRTVGLSLGMSFIMLALVLIAPHLADKRQVPVILDTDDKDKAARYEHLGMKLDRVRSCGEQFHMYDLVREYKERQ